MELQEAKDLLNSCDRYELRDHAFGDCEVTWFLADGSISSGTEVASGYFTSRPENASVRCRDWYFEAEQATQLRNCGTLKTVERNDETGPDEYKEGVTMPGLTLEGVRKELERKIEIIKKKYND